MSGNFERYLQAIANDPSTPKRNRSTPKLKKKVVTWQNPPISNILTYENKSYINNDAARTRLYYTEDELQSMEQYYYTVCDYYNDNNIKADTEINTNESAFFTYRSRIAVAYAVVAKSLTKGISVATAYKDVKKRLKMDNILQVDEDEHYRYRYPYREAVQDIKGRAVQLKHQNVIDRQYWEEDDDNDKEEGEIREEHIVSNASTGRDDLNRGQNHSQHQSCKRKSTQNGTINKENQQPRSSHNSKNDYVRTHTKKPQLHSSASGTGSALVQVSCPLFGGMHTNRRDINNSTNSINSSNNNKKKRRLPSLGDNDIDNDNISSKNSRITAAGSNSLHNRTVDMHKEMPPPSVTNVIASCNRDINEKSKAIVPPWPNDYRFPHANCLSAVWSPDGTRVAYTSKYEGIKEHVSSIVIVDQQHDIVGRINNNDDMHSLRDYRDLQFSPNGRFLLSADDDGIVELWGNNVAGNYEQLQEWNIREGVGRNWHDYSIAISACSKYIVMATSGPWSSGVVLKNVENGATVGSLTPQPVMEHITRAMFSADGRAVFICGWCRSTSVIKLWRPYLDDADEDSLTTLWEQENCFITTTVFSHDKTMIAMQDMLDSKRWLVSIDINYSCTVQQLNVEGNKVPLDKPLQFTPDGQCIIYATKNGLKYWSVAERKFTDNEFLFSNREQTISGYNFRVMNCSPNARQVIAVEWNFGMSSLRMKSIF